MEGSPQSLRASCFWWRDGGGRVSKEGKEGKEGRKEREGRKKKTNRLLDRNTVTIEFTVCWTTRVTESTVGVFIPVFGSGDVGFGSVRPEDGSDAFLASSWCEGLGTKGRKKRLLEYEEDLEMK